VKINPLSDGPIKEKQKSETAYGRIALMLLAD